MKVLYRVLRQRSMRERIQISPTSPTGTRSPVVGSNSPSSTHGSARPQDRRRPAFGPPGSCSSGCRVQTVPDVSVMPYAWLKPHPNT